MGSSRQLVPLVEYVTPMPAVEDVIVLSDTDDEGQDKGNVEVYEVESNGNGNDDDYMRLVLIFPLFFDSVSSSAFKMKRFRLLAVSWLQPLHLLPLQNRRSVYCMLFLRSCCLHFLVFGSAESFLGILWLNTLFFELKPRAGCEILAVGVGLRFGQIGLWIVRLLECNKNI